MRPTSTRPDHRIPLDINPSVITEHPVVLTSDEWAAIDHCHTETTDQVHARLLAAAYTHGKNQALDDARVTGHKVTLELEVSEDATDAELLIAARRALAANR